MTNQILDILKLQNFFAMKKYCIFYCMKPCSSLYNTVLLCACCVFSSNLSLSLALSLSLSFSATHSDSRSLAQHHLIQTGSFCWQGNKLLHRSPTSHFHGSESLLSSLFSIPLKIKAQAWRQDISWVGSLCWLCLLFWRGVLLHTCKWALKLLDML